MDSSDCVSVREVIVTCQVSFPVCASFEPESHINNNVLHIKFGYLQ